MRCRAFASAFLVLALGALAVHAAPPQKACSNRFVGGEIENFGDAINRFGWNFDGFANDAYGDAKGKRGTYLRNRVLVAGYPVASTTTYYGSLSDWRARRVFGFGADLMVARANLGLFEERYVSVLLVNHSGTPDDPDDDCIVFFASDRNIPIPRRPGSEAWESYDFAVPSESPTLPQPNAGIACPPGVACETCPTLGEACWGVFQFNDCPTRADPDATWDAVIRDVDEVRVSFQHPEYLSLLQDWDVGIDNVGESTCNE